MAGRMPPPPEPAQEEGSTRYPFGNLTTFPSLYAARVTSSRGLADEGHGVGDDAARAREGALGHVGGGGIGASEWGDEEFGTWW